MKKISVFIIACFWLGNSPAQNSLAAGTYATPAEYEVKNLKVLNSSELDYSAVPYGDGVVFTSTRGKSGLFSCTNDFANGHYSDLYFAHQDAEGFFSPPQLLEGEVNGKYHDGTATFTTDEATMIFSRNNRRGTNSKGTIDLKVYEAKWKGGSWIDVNELPFNSDEFASCHPSLNRTGEWMYFASDRPGGYGGMDIYVVERKKQGGWGMPINLGNKVNTSGNEIFPFISPEGILYWSSNGHPGLGGLDVFSMPISNGQEAIRSHLTAPINSPDDDFGFTTNLDGTAGFLTSDREGGLGKDDLYSWKFKGIKPQLAKICVIDRKTGARISDANLNIDPVVDNNGMAGDFGGQNPNLSYLQMQAMNFDGKEYLVLIPYNNGGATPQMPATQGVSCGLKYPVIPGRTYTVKVDKPGYETVLRTVTAEEILANQPEWLIPIGERGPIAMRGKVRDKKDESPIANADVKIVNSCTGEELEVVANRWGEFQFPMDCNCDYEIMASKGDYHYDYEVLYSYDMPCEESNASVLLYLEKDFEPTLRGRSLSKGAVIELEDVYYDYDKYFIRPDAAAELDDVVELMRKYPSLELELSSHTDSRGSDAYNRRLSQNRAQAAVDYIVSRGIERRRLVAAGYGETRLVNHCGNGVDCPDEIHQQNRRTEIKVLRFDEEGVKIID